MVTLAPVDLGVSKTRLWIGLLLSALPVLVMIASAGMKLTKPAGLAEGFAHLGWSVETATGLAILELACVVIYIIPQTAVLGAILVTGYLGGATATHVRIGDPYFLQPLLGVFAWLGLYLRDPRLHAILPLRKG